LNIVHGDKEKLFKIILISNQKLEEGEYQAWFDKMERVSFIK
jgi:hypothetical protein